MYPSIVKFLKVMLLNFHAGNFRVTFGKFPIWMKVMKVMKVMSFLGIDDFCRDLSFGRRKHKAENYSWSAEG
jgi:hypothetical protein